ncbi:MAG: Kef family K(+) transporter [Steroidobacteraceae bacterium]|nr:Kef family K(+) transporter [Steroidobacteraceae bacterium]
MPHDTTLIATIAAGFVLAFAFGFVAVRLRLPPLVGYLAAGVMIGPFTPGFVGDIGLAGQLAEIGVILLMFGVGLHFSIKDLLAVRRIAIPGAVGQILTATLIGAAVAHLWGWSLAAGLTFGLALSVASTVVLLRALEQQRKLETPVGRIAVGWLIVEDLAMVLALVLLPALAESFGGAAGGGAAAAVAGSPWMALALTLGKVAAFVAAALVVGIRVVPWLLERVARTGSRELFTLSVLATALGIAFGSAALFGVSFALGAFFAGVILSESELSHRAAEDSLPLQDAFAVLFFVSVGMLFDPSILLREPLAVLAVVLIIVIGKSLAAFAIVLAFRHPVGTALTVSASLAQIGEFSFILASLGIALNLLPPESRDLILAGALISITLNPFVFAAIPATERWLRQRPRLLAFLERTPGEAAGRDEAPAGMRDHAIVIGHGRVGGAITPVLAAEGLPFLVVDRDRQRFEVLSKLGMPVIYGDASIPGVLESAGVRRARLLVVATPDSFLTRRAVEIARAANPGIEIVVRTHSYAEFERLRSEHRGTIVMGEHELARAMLLHALRHFGVPRERAQLLVQDEPGAQVEVDADRR